MVRGDVPWRALGEGRDEWCILRMLVIHPGGFFRRPRGVALIVTGDVLISEGEAGRVDGVPV